MDRVAIQRNADECNGGKTMSEAQAILGLLGLIALAAVAIFLSLIGNNR